MYNNHISTHTFFNPIKLYIIIYLFTNTYRKPLTTLDFYIWCVRPCTGKHNIIFFVSVYDNGEYVDPKQDSRFEKSIDFIKDGMNS